MPIQIVIQALTLAAFAFFFLNQYPRIDFPGIGMSSLMKKLKIFSLLTVFISYSGIETLEYHG